MAEDFSSRNPPRDASLEELLAESRALLRGQAQLAAQVKKAEVRQARDAPRFQAPQQEPIREEPAAPREQARALERRLTSERGVAEQARRAAIAAENNAAAQARKAEGTLKAAQTRLANLQKAQFGVASYGGGATPNTFRVTNPSGDPFGPRFTSRERAQAAADARSAASGVSPQRITRAETSVASATEKARATRQDAEAAHQAAQAATDQERALRAAANEARAAADAAQIEATARERSARAARETATATSRPVAAAPVPAEQAAFSRWERERTGINVGSNYNDRYLNRYKAVGTPYVVEPKARASSFTNRTGYSGGGYVQSGYEVLREGKPVRSFERLKEAQAYVEKQLLAEGAASQAAAKATQERASAERASAEQTATGAGTRQEIERRTRANLPKMGEAAQMVPTSAMAPLREFDRAPGTQYGRGTEEYKKLKASIEAEGIRNPIRLMFNPETGRAYVGEGNTRLAIAKELGLQNVPVVAKRYPNASEHVPGGGVPGFRYLPGGRVGGDPFPPSALGLPVAPPPSPDVSLRAKTVRTRADIEADIRRETAIAENYAESLRARAQRLGRTSNPQTSSAYRDIQTRLAALREEANLLDQKAAAERAGTPAEAESRKRLDLFREGKSLTGQQTAAEVEQLEVIKQQVRTVQELKAAQREPVPATARPAAQPRLDQGEISQRLEELRTVRANLRNQIPFGNLRSPILTPPPGGGSPPIVIGQGPYRPGGSGTPEAQRALIAERVEGERKIAAQRKASLERTAAQEAKLQAERIAAEEKIGIKRNEAGKPLFTYYGQPSPPPGDYPRFQHPPSTAGQPVLGERGGQPGRPASGPQGFGVVQQYQRSTEGSLASIAGVERAQRNLPRFYQQLQQGAAIQAQASQQMRRHGALTTEFLQALARGETTLSEFRFQIGSTIAKFAGWTAAATSVYGVVAAVGTLGRGAVDSLTGVNQLGRFVTNLDTQRAQSQFRALAREFHLPVSEVVQGASGIAQVFHNQNQALEATRVVLTAVRVAELDVGDATNKLIPIVQGFKLNASDLADVLGAVNQAQNDFGVSIPDSLAGIGKAAGQLKAAGGDFYTATAFIATAKRVTGQSGDAIGTALRRSAILIRRPSNRDVLERYGIDPDADYNTILNESLKLGERLSKQGLTGRKQLSELATKGLATPQIGPIFTAVLQNRDLFERVFRDIQPDRARVGLARELRFVLSSIRDQFKSIRAEAEAIGAGLAQAGFFDAFGVFLQTMRLTLSLANDLLTVFNDLPVPLKKAAAYLLEGYAALRLLRRTGIGPGLASRNEAAFGFLGYSPREQLRRGAIANQRNISQGFANQAEQLGNRYQLAATGTITEAQAAIAARERSLALQRVPNIDQREVERADQEAAAHARQSLRFNQETLALKREQAIVAAGLTESDAILLGLQKKEILPSQAAGRQGGALYTLSAGGESQRVSEADARKVEARARLGQAAAATAAVGATQTKLAASYSDLGRAGGIVAGAATSAGAAATQAAVQTEVAAVAAAREAVELNATAETQAALAGAYERLGAAFAVAAAGAAKTAAAAEEASAGSEAATATAAREGGAVDTLAVAQAELAAANKRLGVAVGALAKAENAGEVAIAETAVASDLAAVAAAEELVALEVAVVSQGRMAASFALLSSGLGTAGAAGAALARGLGRFLLNPFVIGIAALEGVPRLIDAQKKAGDDFGKQLDNLQSPTGSLQKQQRELEQKIKKGPSSSALGTIGDTLSGFVTGHFAKSLGQTLNPFELENERQRREDLKNARERARQIIQQRLAAQRAAESSGADVPYLSIKQVTDRFKTVLSAQAHGAASGLDLSAAYQKALRELKVSTAALDGGAQGRKAAEEAAHALRSAMLQATGGIGLSAKAIEDLPLADLATALTAAAGRIGLFGLQSKSKSTIAREYSRAAKLVSDDPTPENIKAFAVAKQGLDAVLQDAQTQLQQSLTLATTGPQREAAYAQFFASVPGVSTALRNRLTQGQRGAAQTRAKLLSAQKQQRELQNRYDAAEVRAAPTLLDRGQQFEQDLGAPSVGALLGSNIDDQQKKELDAQKKNVEALGKSLKSQRKGVKNLRDLYERDKKAYEAVKREVEQQQAQSENQVAELQAQILAGRTNDPVAAITIQLRAAHRALQNDIRHHVSQEQRLQDELKIQGLQDQQLQAQIQQIQTEAALKSSRIDPVNTTAVDRSNLSGLYQELAKARSGRPSPARTEQLKQIQTQINQARFQQAQDIRQQAQSENDAYYAYLEAGQGTLHPVLVAQLEYQKALHALKFAHGKVERLTALANIKIAQENLAEAVHQNAIDETTAYFGLAESKTTDPLKIARLEYQKALQLQKQARGPKEKQQTTIDKNNALKNLYQTQADERLKTIEFEAGIDKITSDQEISALKRLLKLKHLTKDFRRQILTQIHQLENQDSSSVELNVGNIRLPTLYDVRRLAAQGASYNQPPQQSSGSHLQFQQTIHNYNTIASTADADAVGARLEHHSRTALASAVRKLGNRRR